MVPLGERLRNKRMHKQLTIEEVAKETKIKEQFLRALEKGDYHKLPSPAYAQGFVRNYATYLGLPQQEIIALFRREFDAKKHYKVLPDSLAKTKEFPLKRIRIHQSLVVVLLILLVFIGYLAFQYRYLFLAPSLEITEPVPGASVSQEVTVVGKTNANATVMVNNVVVTLDEHGEFSKKVTLFPGNSVITITATNRMGKETVVTREVKVR